MSGKEIDSSILSLNGLKSKESLKEIILKPKICSRCDTINAVDSKFCSKCAGILDIKTAYELQEKTLKEQEIRKNSDDILNILMKDPSFVTMFVSKVKELGLTQKAMVTLP
jgi:ribosomal protein L40E